MSFRICLERGGGVVFFYFFNWKTGPFLSDFFSYLLFGLLVIMKEFVVRTQTLYNKHNSFRIWCSCLFFSLQKKTVILIVRISKSVHQFIFFSVASFHHYCNFSCREELIKKKTDRTAL